MKAIRKLRTGSGFVELNEIPEPIIGSNDVKIKIEAVGICGTDIKILHGDTWSNPPVTLGHEISGIVSEVGSEVKNIKVGDRVISETAQIICGECYFCKSGNYLMCKKRLSIGYGTNGGMAEYIVVRKDIIHKLPDSIDLDCGALCEPAAVSVHAVYDSVKITPTDVVLVTGPGTIGLIVAQIVKSFGATVIMTGLDKDINRLNIAVELGIDIIADIEKENIEEIIAQYTDNRGVDIVFECTGTQSSINSSMNILKNMGSLVQIGLAKPHIEIPYNLLTGREIRLIGTFGHKWESWETAIKLIAEKKINVGKLITHRYSIDDWQEAFSTAEKMDGIKVLIYPNS